MLQKPERLKFKCPATHGKELKRKLGVFLLINKTNFRLDEEKVLKYGHSTKLSPINACIHDHKDIPI